MEKRTNKTIYKYPLELTDVQTLEVPFGAKVLSTELQGHQICVWAIVDLTTVEPGPTENLTIRIVGTGNPLPEKCIESKFLGTVTMPPFVWHVFLED